ncbi:protein sidekick-2-like isoform X2 [Acanthaster planci]|uniref:Protein sidekick-2-like isoform X2 n=1 Tax=Acanthaster planci TaxID=133434 RepID=A0A8B7XJS9_ACAPL|nr:protein sidekick-2-like isoform X2 [Acanthaster planci]
MTDTSDNNRGLSQNSLCQRCVNSRSCCNQQSWVLTAWFLYSCFCIASSAVPPFINRHPQGDTAFAGNTELLSCQALGDTPLEYQWLKDNLILGNYDAQGAAYLLRNIQRSDAGEYRCRVRNDIGTVMSKRAVLHVAYFDSFVGGDRTEIATAGQAVILSCPDVDSFPAASIKWRKDGDDVSSDNKIVTIDNRLVILDSSSADEGVYTCLAKNDFTQESRVSPSITLTVQGVNPPSIVPSIVVPPRDTVFIQGDSIANMECIVNARPLVDLSITWKRNGVVLQTGGTEAFTYQIRSPSQSTKGVYECEAAMPSGVSVRATANLTSYSPPTFVNPPQQTTISSVGSDVTIPCEAAGTPRPIVTWFKNTVDVTTLGLSRFQVLDSGMLQITSTEAVDAGMYQCVISNEAGEDITDTWLQVREIAPTFTSEPQDTTKIEGEPAMMSCQAVGAPKPTITWLRDGSTPVPDDLIQDNGDLFFASTVASDTADYMCVADNGVGTINVTARLTVYIPTVIQTPPHDTKVQLSLPAVIDCVVQHDPAVTVTVLWYHNTALVDTDASSRVNLLASGSLEIRQTLRSDKGTYECVVTSVAGNGRRNATLTIQELPWKPTNVASRISPSDSRTVELSWVAPFDGNSPLLRYIIEQKEDESAFTVIDSSVDPSLPSFNVVGVIPSRSYQFKVRAENILGAGEKSDPTLVLHIPEEPPDEAPNSVVTSSSSTTSIIVEWQTPPEDTWNGPLRGYILRYKLYGYTSTPYTPVNITSVRQTSYTLQGLEIWTRYEIQVAAYNGAGVGIYSQSLAQRTKEGVPSEAPRNVQTTVLNSTAIQFQWQMPDPQTINGINQGYKLHAWLNGSESSKIEVIVDPNPAITILEGTISGLKKYTEYKTSVLCFTSPGDGLASPTVTVRTHEDVPGSVGSLKLKDVVDTSLKVEWTVPTETNGVIRGYEIKWYRYNTTSTSPPISLPPEQREYTVTGLTATTRYTLVMWARTSVGRGPPKETSFSSGVPPLRPDPPSQLAISNIQSSSVHLQFEPGFSGHTSISAWIVEAQVGTSTAWLRLYEHQDPDSRGFPVPNLIPYMDYVFRLRAQNIAGESEPSQTTRRIQTLQDTPEIAPREVTVRAHSETSLRVRWVPLLKREWSGEPIGYHIYWQEVNAVTPDPTQGSYDLLEPYTGEYVIAGLQEWTEYSVQVQAYNEIGAGPISDGLVGRTTDTVPSSGPSNVTARATGPFVIDVTWGPVPKIDQNGAILGYKVRYYATSSPSEQLTLDVTGEASMNGSLSGLRGYTRYALSVLAYTRMGDGMVSSTVVVETQESVPGPPSGILFPVVTNTSAKITWRAPVEPNGIIQSYRVSYVQQGFPDNFKQTTEVGMAQEYTVSNLFDNTYYSFSVAAKTRLGWGQEASAIVITTNDRTAPTAPSKPSVDYIHSRDARISWTPGMDGNGPLRFYSLQIKEGAGSFLDRATHIDPGVISYFVDKLSPYTDYQFRLKAHNDVGPSPWSEESDVISTEQDVPDGEPGIQEVTPITPTSVRVIWTAPPISTHNGPLEGYRISYTELPDGSPVERASTDPSLLQYELANLLRYQDYEIKVRAYNTKGAGPCSRPVTVYVGVAIPSAAPSNVMASASGASSLRVTWEALPEEAKNGGLQGYKITYWETPSEARSARETPIKYTKTFPSEDTEATLDGLKCFTEYSLTVIGFNSAGDGPASDEITSVTEQSVPGIPAAVGFQRIRMTSLNLTWAPPELPCGQIKGYQVYYESITPIDGEISTITVEINGPLLTYGVEKLGEFATYTFRVKARTDGRSYGPYREANVTTGPQPGMPGPPGALYLEAEVDSFKLSWTRPEETGASQLIGYILESQEEGRSEWETQTDSVSPDALYYNVPYGNLKTSTRYKFRVMAENQQSISFPKATSELKQTPAGENTEQPDPGLTQKMFYEEWWFLVIVGLVVLIVLILITATLCMLGKSRLYKERKAHSRVNLDDPVSIHDGNLSDTFEMQQGNGTNGRSTGGRGRGRGRGGNRNGIYSRTNSYTRPPPRPSPGSIQYSEEEESKHYEAVHRQPSREQDETSSLTEKADLQSQTDSQSSCGSKGSESDIEYTEDPHSFVNHYASVPASAYPSHSWKRQKGPKAYSYTDSESDMHSIHINGLAGMPAGSRAPLHGFSSFV